MATTHDPKPPGAPRRAGTRRPDKPRRFRWTTEQYDRLAELGVFGRRRVELLDGEIWEKMTIKPPHAIACELLDNAVRTAFGAGHRFRIQQPLDLGRRSQPEPDMAVVNGSPRDSPDHPTTALLVVEVSETSLSHDRHLKAHIYAQAGILDYWIVNLVDRRLEIHRNPGPHPSHKGRFAYADVTVVPATGSAAPLAAPGRALAVADLLP